jgi:hypothetical protein
MVKNTSVRTRPYVHAKAPLCTRRQRHFLADLTMRPRRHRCASAHPCPSPSPSPLALRGWADASVRTQPVRTDAQKNKNKNWYLFAGKDRKKTFGFRFSIPKIPKLPKLPKLPDINEGTIHRSCIWKKFRSLRFTNCCTVLSVKAILNPG